MDLFGARPERAASQMFIFYNILTLIGALGLFIYGLKVMSEGLQRISGERMRRFLGRATSGPLSGVFTGFSTTALVQSSSATTAMVVSFVNSSVLDLRQGLGVIMGANIGTTFTAVLIMVLGFSSFGIAPYTLPVIAIGFPFLLTRDPLLKYIGEILVGFGLLFFGLDTLRESVLPLIERFHEGVPLLSHLGGTSVLVFLIIGFGITFLIGSSSALFALGLIACDHELLSLGSAMALMLGGNIGTTITASLLVGIVNADAKRSALSHVLFNLIGAVWVLILFQPLVGGIGLLTENFAPMADTQRVLWGVTVFHVGFNVVNTLLLLGPVKPLSKFLEKLVPASVTKESRNLEFIQTGIVGTPELSMIEARKEVRKMADLDQRILDMVRQQLFETDQKKGGNFIKRIRKKEETTDRIEVEIADYLSKVSEDELSSRTSLRVRAMLNVIKDLEKIGDILYEMARNIRSKHEQKIWFTQEQRADIQKMIELLNEAFDIMLSNLGREEWEVDLEKARDQEERIDQYASELHGKYLEHVQSGEKNIMGWLIYNDLLSSCETVGNHVLNVSERMMGRV